MAVRRRSVARHTFCNDRRKKPLAVCTGKPQMMDNNKRRARSRSRPARQAVCLPPLLASLSPRAANTWPFAAILSRSRLYHLAPSSRCMLLRSARPCLGSAASGRMSCTRAAAAPSLSAVQPVSGCLAPLVAFLIAFASFPACVP